MLKRLRPGGILIEKNSGVWGAGAKLLFGAEHQHAALVLHDTSHVIEAVWSGVRVNPMRNLERYEYWEPRCASNIRSMAVYRAMSRTGDAYGYTQLALAVAQRRLGLPTPDVPGRWCGELISWAYDQSGYDVNIRLADHHTGPWDLRNPDRLERIF